MLLLIIINCMHSIYLICTIYIIMIQLTIYSYIIIDLLLIPIAYY